MTEIKSLTVVGLILALIMYLLHKRKAPEASVGFQITEPDMVGLKVGGTGIPEHEKQLPITHVWDENLPINQRELVLVLKQQGYTDVQIENFRHQVRY